MNSITGEQNRTKISPLVSVVKSHLTGCFVYLPNLFVAFQKDCLRTASKQAARCIFAFFGRGKGGGVERTNNRSNMRLHRGGDWLWMRNMWRTLTGWEGVPGIIIRLGRGLDFGCGKDCAGRRQQTTGATRVCTGKRAGRVFRGIF